MTTITGTIRTLTTAIAIFAFGMTLNTSNAFAAAPTAAEIAAAQKKIEDANDALDTAKEEVRLKERALSKAQADLAKTPSDDAKATAVDTAKDELDTARRTLVTKQHDVQYYAVELGHLKPSAAPRRTAPSPTAVPATAKPVTPAATDKTAEALQAMAKSMEAMTAAIVTMGSKPAPAPVNVGDALTRSDVENLIKQQTETRFANLESNFQTLAEGTAQIGDAVVKIGSSPVLVKAGGVFHRSVHRTLDAPASQQAAEGTQRIRTIIKK